MQNLMEIFVFLQPSMVSHLDYFSGMIFQVVIKQKRGYDILALGGRFDKLISTLATTLNVEDKNYKSPYGVGVSLGLETLAARIREEDMSSWTRLDVVIHSISSNATVSAKLELAHQLWNKGVRCSLADPNWGVDEVQEFANEAGAGLIVIFQESGPNVRLLELQNERFTERKVGKHDILAVVLSKVLDTNEIVPTPGLSRMDSSSRVFEASAYSPTVSSPQINIDFQYFPEKRNNTIKKHLESRISSKLMPSLNTSSPLTTLNVSTFVQVLVLPFAGSVIRSVIATMDFDAEETKFNECLKELIAKHSRHKKELTSLCQDISDLKSAGKAGIPPSVFVLYSSEDHTYKILFL